MSIAAFVAVPVQIAQRFLTHRRYLATFALVVGIGWPAANAQTIDVLEFHPFVIAVRPVVGNGGVGGVSIDAQGAVARADVDAEGRLRDAWQAALDSAPDDDVLRASPLRKISLRRLERALGESAKADEPIAAELQFLAGLQRIQFVFVYPDQSDIVLAGPAEGWHIDDAGNIVGRRSGRPVLHLEDLLVALAAADATPGEAIRCSIDPAPAGLQKLQQLTRSGRIATDAAGLRQLEETLGPQQVTIGGVPTSSRFARVMLAADYRMKRLAMGFEAAPIDGLPDFFELLSQSPASSKLMTPRWWLAANYQPLARDAEGLAWELRGPGVECRTEEHQLNAAGQAVQTGKASPVAARWAKNMTDHFADLGQRAPVFAELQGLMDAAIVAALLAKEDLYDRSGWSLPTLRDPQAVRRSEFQPPTFVPSCANLARLRGSAAVSVSGGVEIDPWSIVADARQDSKPAAARKKAAPPADGLRWWWD